MSSPKARKLLRAARVSSTMRPLPFALVLALVAPACAGPAPRATSSVDQAQARIAVPTAPPVAGAPPAPHAEAAPSGPLFTAPPLYAALFELDRTFHFRVTTKSSRYDDEKHGAVHDRSSGDGNCRVTDVTRVASAIASTLRCEDLPSNGALDPLSGRWVATARGLYRLREERDVIADPPRDEEIVLSAVPVEKDQTRKDPSDPSFGERVTVKKKGHAWCASTASWGGDEGWSSVCLEPGVGVRSGTWGWAGGSTRESELALVP